MDEISKFYNIPNYWEQFDESDLKSSTMMNFFCGKTVFLTGATGFLGQLYMEKLLRCDVKCIYILARSKKNKTAEERLKEMFTGIQFSLLKKHFPNFINRITIVEGDLSELGVGIEEESLKMLRAKVNIVIHAGADVRFQEKLIRLLLVNLRGTRELLRLAETFEKLEAFTYISTAYSNSPKGNYIYEKFYECPIDPDTMIAMAERLGKNQVELDRFEELTDSIIKPWPNTYSFTKSLSEGVVRSFGKKFPVAVIRPSIVISTCREPVPGWSNSLSGYNGGIMARCLGFVRTSFVSKDLLVDLVCADYVVNSTLAVIWITCEDALKNSEKKPKTKIYNISSSKDHRMTWGNNALILQKCYKQMPAERSLWKPSDNITMCPVMLKYRSILYHFSTAILFDIIFKIFGKKIRLLPHYRKMQMFNNTLNYFLTNEWIFENTNVHCLIDRMSPLDQKLFNFDIRQFNFEKWAPIYLQGLKVYLIGEKLDEKSVRDGIKKYKRFEKAHILALLAYYGISAAILYGIAKCFGIINYIENTLRRGVSES